MDIKLKHVCSFSFYKYTNQRYASIICVRPLQSVCLTSVFTLLITALLFVSEKNQDVLEDAGQVHEQGQCMPNVVPVPDAELFHDEMSVIQDEGRHDEKSKNQLHVCDGVRSNEDVENGCEKHSREC